uniref:Phospho-2-dehydro-3-deoxyheptonate aldolase n=2 Tax=Oryza sativa subsp. japonica TaxID=39947 RepID=Q10C99_ORYSJ|nr:putative phosphate synthase [Oryza sativa Japonica Group]ABF99273.1 hypothetical protein LOC_Os03g57610 [Oryza sativa Japonica Group]
MPDPDLVQWTNVWLDVPLVLLLVVQSALKAWLRPAEFESSPAPCLPVTDVLDSPSVPATDAYADGLTMDHPIMTTEFWTSHECLLLPYEQALPENIRVKLPHLIRAVHVAVQIVTWVTDPMHGNTMKAPCGLKTRSFATFQYLLVPITSQYWKAILVYENLSNPYGIAGTLLHVQVSQSYLPKPKFIFNGGHELWEWRSICGCGHMDSQPLNDTTTRTEVKGGKVVSRK